MKRYEHGGNPYALERRIGLSLDQVLDFSANINPLGPSAVGLEAVRAALEGFRGPLTRYPDPDYTQLRQRLAASHGGTVETDWIYPTNGGIEAIHDVFRALKPQRALIVAPAFVEYEKAARAWVGDVVFFDLKSSDSFRVNAAAFLEVLDCSRPDLVILGSPNNPTGQLVSRDLLIQVLNQLKGWGGSLLTDEAFMEFLEDEAAWSMAEAVKDFDHLFVARSLTKFFSVPGLRAGYLMTANEGFREYWNLIKPVWGMNALAEIYILAALEDRDYIFRTRTAVCQLRERLIKGLERFSDLRVYTGTANYLLVSLQRPGEVHLAEALEPYGLLIRDCRNYQGLGPGYYRLAVLEESAQELLFQGLEAVLGGR